MATVRVGTTLRKKFAGCGFFDGKVVAVADGRATIEWSDDTTTEMTAKEVEKCCAKAASDADAATAREAEARAQARTVASQLKTIGALEKKVAKLEAALDKAKKAAAKKAAAKKAAAKKPAAAKKTDANKPTAAKKDAAKKPAAKPAARPGAKPAAKKPASKKKVAKTATVKKPAAKKPAAKAAKAKRPAAKAATAAEKARLADVGDRARSALRGVVGDAPWLEGLSLTEFAPCRPETSRRDMGPGRVNLYRSIAHRATWSHEASGASLVVEFRGDHCATYERGGDGAWDVGTAEEDDMAYRHASGVGCASAFSANVDLDFVYDGKTHSASVHLTSGDHPGDQGMSLSLGFRTDAAAFKRAIRDSLGSEALGLTAGSKRAMSLEHFFACAFGGLVVMDPLAGFMHMLRPGAYLDAGYQMIGAAGHQERSRNFAKVARALYYDEDGECRVAAASFVAYPPGIFADPAGVEGKQSFQIW